MKLAVTLELKGSCWVPGLRPFLWNLVKETDLGGWVSNTVDGVQLHLKGDDLAISLFLRSLPEKLTRKFQIHTIELTKRVQLPENAPAEPFRLAGPICYDGLVPADRAPCPACKKQMLDPDSPYYRYPFLNCVECGPGYSVTTMAGGKREGTTFHSFPPCEKCSAKLKTNPTQVCPDCGPSVFLITGEGEPVPTEDPLAYAGKMLAEGKIVAIKNYDGFSLLCDPFRHEAVRKLRKRKKQQLKPISLYVNDLSILKENCAVTPEEEQLLSLPSAPVVLLHLKPGTPLKRELFCPDNPETIGAAYPPTGLLHILMESRPAENGGFCSFGMLAFSGGPLPVDPADAGGDDDLAEVAGIADLIIMHDLKIWHASGPSVQTILSGTGLQTIRRSTGFSPEPILLRKTLKRTVLALGADSCAAVSLGFKNKIIQSHQMGDICSDRNARSLSLAAQQLVMMFARIPDIIICDMDHTSFSAKIGEELSGKCRIPLATTQRHHANALACMAEHHLKKALALVWDGGAAGTDGTIWGAELLDISFQNFRRLATFAPVHMRKPRERTIRPDFLLTRYLDQYGIPLTDQIADLLEIPMQDYEAWVHSESFGDTTGTHAALTLFDAVSSVIGIAPPVKHYGQQILLRMEHAVSQGFDDQNVRQLIHEFPFRVREDDCLLIDWGPFFEKIGDLKQLRRSSCSDLTAAFFHSAANAALQMVQYGAGVSAHRDIVLSGKAFLSPTLTRLVSDNLSKAGFRVFLHHITSPEESSVSIGQAIAGGML